MENTKPMTDLLNTTSVFDSKHRNHLEEPMFFGEGINVSRFDSQKYPFFEKQTVKQIGFSWVPEEVSMEQDREDFKNLAPAAQHIFTSNILFQTCADSVQGRAPSQSLLRCVSIPELESFIEAWSYFEGPIHSRSYSHIIRNIYDNPTKEFDKITDVDEIVNRAAAMSKYYDDFINYNDWYVRLGFGEHTINGQKLVIEEKELYKRLYLMMVSIYILEGIRFYASFACSWAFADAMKVMKKNAKIIKLICRDENVHMATVNFIIRTLASGQEGALFKQIAKEQQETVNKMFLEAAQLEFEWADYLFKDGSIIGLNADILKDFVKWITNKRVKALNMGLDKPFEDIGAQNPLPWTEKWINGQTIQSALQETESTAYSLGGIDRDSDKYDDIKGMEL